MNIIHLKKKKTALLTPSSFTLPESPLRVCIRTPSEILRRSLPPGVSPIPSPSRVYNSRIGNGTCSS